MFNYVIADINRTFRKKTFLGALGFYIGIFALMIFIYFNPLFTTEMYVGKVTSFISFLPLFIGPFVFIVIYADDYKSRAMQVAIGYGINREKIVWLKLIESIIILSCIALIMGIVLFLTPILIGLQLMQIHILNIVLTVLTEIIRTIGYLSISTILVYSTQNAINGIILYILFSTKTIYFLLLIAGQELLISKFGNFTNYIFTIALNSSKERFIASGNIQMSLLFMLVIHIIIPTMISMFIFKKKELEF